MLFLANDLRIRRLMTSKLVPLGNYIQIILKLHPGQRSSYPLQAFECLLNLDLPNFRKGNWKSNVRNKVCVHQKYRDMEDWTGPETADIVYEDEGPEFVLTDAFSEYLPKNRLKEGAAIKYYLEVKTTTEDSSSRFFVSKAQYRRDCARYLHMICWCLC